LRFQFDGALIATAVSGGGKVGPLGDFDFFSGDAGFGDGVEEFDLESAFDDTDGEDLIEVSGNFFFGFYAEALEAVVGLVIGPEVSCSDLADVVIAIRAFFDAVGSSGEALFSGGVCGAGGRWVGRESGQQCLGGGRWWRGIGRWDCPY